VLILFSLLIIVSLMNFTAVCVGVTPELGSEGPNITETGGVLLTGVRVCARVVV
jgi:hypothetical protein